MDYLPELLQDCFLEGKQPLHQERMVERDGDEVCWWLLRAVAPHDHFKSLLGLPHTGDCRALNDYSEHWEGGAANKTTHRHACMHAYVHMHIHARICDRSGGPGGGMCPPPPQFFIGGP